MVRTKDSAGVKVSHKANRKITTTSTMESSSKSTDKHCGGGNPYHPRETPSWQKEITKFFPKNGEDCDNGNITATPQHVTSDAMDVDTKDEQDRDKGNISVLSTTSQIVTENEKEDTIEKEKEDTIEKEKEDTIEKEKEEFIKKDTEEVDEKVKEEIIEKVKEKVIEEEHEDVTDKRLEAIQEEYEEDNKNENQDIIKEENLEVDKEEPKEVTGENDLNDYDTCLPTFSNNEDDEEIPKNKRKLSKSDNENISQSNNEDDEEIPKNKRKLSNSDNENISQSNNEDDEEIPKNKRKLSNSDDGNISQSNNEDDEEIPKNKRKLSNSDNENISQSNNEDDEEIPKNKRKLSNSEDESISQSSIDDCHSTSSRDIKDGQGTFNKKSKLEIENISSSEDDELVTSVGYGTKVRENKKNLKDFVTSVVECIDITSSTSEEED